MGLPEYLEAGGFPQIVGSRSVGMRWNNYTRNVALQTELGAASISSRLNFSFDRGDRTGGTIGVENKCPHPCPIAHRKSGCNPLTARNYRC